MNVSTHKLDNGERITVPDTYESYNISQDHRQQMELSFVYEDDVNTAERTVSLKRVSSIADAPNDAFLVASYTHSNSGTFVVTVE